MLPLKKGIRLDLDSIRYVNWTGSNRDSAQSPKFRLVKYYSIIGLTHGLSRLGCEF